jgi:hypothetical protein
LYELTVTNIDSLVIQIDKVKNIDNNKIKKAQIFQYVENTIGILEYWTEQPVPWVFIYINHVLKTIIIGLTVAMQNVNANRHIVYTMLCRNSVSCVT